MREGTLWLAAALLVVLGCATQSMPGGSGDPDVLTAEEIRSLNVSTAMEAIRRLRPLWLRARSRGDQPAVYVDGIREADVDALGSITVERVREIRYLSGPDATTRFGTGHRGGAILVTTRG